MKREAWAAEFALLQQRMVRLEKLEADLIEVAHKLTRRDIAEQTALMVKRSRIANGLDAFEQAASGEQIYDRLLENTQRFREETERAINLVEQLLARHRTATDS